MAAVARWPVLSPLAGGSAQDAILESRENATGKLNGPYELLADAAEEEPIGRDRQRRGDNGEYGHIKFGSIRKMLPAMKTFQPQQRYIPAHTECTPQKA
ncbi:hypothetical protein E4U61_007920 [Claviceps capensis]|nr:hypothetical protein E4U61_007920 [Claviceps capensis]